MHFPNKSKWTVAIFEKIFLCLSPSRYDERRTWLRLNTKCRKGYLSWPSAENMCQSQAFALRSFWLTDWKELMANASLCSFCGIWQLAAVTVFWLGEEERRCIFLLSFSSLRMTVAQSYAFSRRSGYSCVSAGPGPRETGSQKFHYLIKSVSNHIHIQRFTHHQYSHAENCLLSSLSLKHLSLPQ